VPKKEGDGLGMEVAARLEVCEALKLGDLCVGMDEASEVAEIRGPDEPGPGPLPMEDGPGKDHGEQDAVVKREDSQGTANVEVANAMGVVAGVEEDAGDEKAGEDEEEVDPGPAVGELEVVLEEDEKESDGAEAVERRIKGTIFRACVGGVARDYLGFGDVHLRGG